MFKSFRAREKAIEIKSSPSNTSLAVASTSMPPQSNIVTKKKNCNLGINQNSKAFHTKSSKL